MNKVVFEIQHQPLLQPWAEQNGLECHCRPDRMVVHFEPDTFELFRLVLDLPWVYRITAEQFLNHHPDGWMVE